MVNFSPAAFALFPVPSVHTFLLISSVLQSCYYQFGLSATRFNPCLSLSSGGVVYMCAAPTSPFLWAALYTCIVYSCQQKKRVNLDRNQRCVCIAFYLSCGFYDAAAHGPLPPFESAVPRGGAVFAHLCHHGLPAIPSANMPNIMTTEGTKKNRKKQVDRGKNPNLLLTDTSWHTLFVFHPPDSGEGS